jgi:MFS family permease
MSHEQDGRAGRNPGHPGPRDQPARSSFLADLRAVLGERDFRKLFATRLISQAGDGVFNAGLGAYVFFSAQSFPDPGAAAVAFAVLYLPYSLVGPFAGVFIDRWSRRQILVWSALARFVFVAVAAAFVATGTFGLPLYIGALLVLGVNRFFLSSLSAALPHVISSDKLVMANAVAPTSGTVVAFIGGIVGIGVHLVTGGGQVGSAATLMVGGLCYAAAGVTATRMPRDLLGPAREQLVAASRAGIGAELATVVRGLAAGTRHVLGRRRAAAVLLATASSRFLYGILLLMSVLLYRNYFYRDSGSNSALGHYLLIVIASAIGYGAAAVVTPIATRRLTKMAWITILLAAGGITTGLLGTGFRQPGFLLIGFLLGVVAQGVAICSATTLQQEVDDEFRGRVFSLYDMLFNGAFVAGAAASALFMPDNGHSYAMLLVVSVGYVLAAGGYALVSRQAGGGPAGSTGPSGAPDPSAAAAAATPSSAAQPSSS